MDINAQLKRYRAIEELYPDIRLLTKKYHLLFMHTEPNSFAALLCQGTYSLIEKNLATYVDCSSGEMASSLSRR